ncbi:hypothetical protein M3182_07415 [Mesobacillus maritimus]|nr:hypothetical protein [Mesobacillus maritimus]MCM3669047.1 hypothetical protein [Mesobacillus maritimus]
MRPLYERSIDWKDEYCREEIARRNNNLRKKHA